MRAAEALRRGLTVEEIHSASKFDPWFLRQIEGIVAAEAEIKSKGLPTITPACCGLKKMGFSDARLAKLSGKKAKEILTAAPQGQCAPGLQAHRHLRGGIRLADLVYVFLLRGHRLDGNAIGTPRVRGQPERPAQGHHPRRRAQPHRPGHRVRLLLRPCAYALREAGIETIMVNCNPETVSTDYDTSDRLYFEPLTAEDVIELARVEQRKGHPARRHRAVRRPDAAEARRRARASGDPDPWHLARCHRPRGGP
jgi:carbamoyl-phosphate synthase large subunit